MDRQELGLAARIRRGLLAFLVALPLTALVLPATTASAHGSCDLWTGGPALLRSYIISFQTEDNKYVKGQTKFFCEGRESHSTVYVQVKLFGCKSSHNLGLLNECNPGENFQVVAGGGTKGENTCRNTAMCQKTVTKACTGDMLYKAKGRFAAYTSSGALQHSNPIWSALEWAPAENSFVWC